MLGGHRPRRVLQEVGLGGFGPVEPYLFFPSKCWLKLSEKKYFLGKVFFDKMVKTMNDFFNPD